jgi:formylglycine-generating enzyme required for sulfatase activity
MKMKHGLGNIVFALPAVFALLYTACPGPALPHTAVTGITGVPTEGTAGIPIVFIRDYEESKNGITVHPNNATNRAIEWSVKDAGTTGAVFSSYGLETSAEGTVVVTETIGSGAGWDTDYTQNFSITIIPFVAVTGITGAPPTAGTARTPLALSGLTVEPANASSKDIYWTVKDHGGTGAGISGDLPGGYKLTTVWGGTVVVTAYISNGTAPGTSYTKDFTITITFVKVTGITDVPTTGTAGIPLTLSGTVEPANASSKNIAWSVKTAGTTGAVISGNTLTAANGGTVVVTATIADGLAAWTPYTQDFSINILSPTPAQYRELVLATPNAFSDVTITGSSVYSYNNSTYDFFKGVFIADRTVTLSPFQIAKYETTYELWYEVKQWAAGHGYAFANPGREGHDGTDGAAPTPAAKTEPVTRINWRDAVVWCNAYSETEGKTPVYYTDSTYTTVLRTSTNDGGTNTAADKAVMKPAANGYRLPTEAEWEYAARGGKTPSTSGPFAYTWAGVNTETDLGVYAWYDDNSGIATHPVGGKTANTLGLYDMTGNVWEWCWDWYDSVDTGTAINPTGPTSGTTRAARGGCWENNAGSCPVPRRIYGQPYPANNALGFRVVRP